jgi:hypothetical protein
MKPEEQNIVIAKELGWVEREVVVMAMHFPGGLLPTKAMRWFRGEWSELLSQGIENLPSYVTDANTRLEMLKALTRDQKDKLVRGKSCVECLELTPTQFAELWLKVKSLWVDDQANEKVSVL